MRLDSNLTTALYKSFTYLLTYLLTYYINLLLTYLEKRSGNVADCGNVRDAFPHVG